MPKQYLSITIKCNLLKFFFKFIFNLLYKVCTIKYVACIKLCYLTALGPRFSTEVRFFSVWSFSCSPLCSGFPSGSPASSNLPNHSSRWIGYSKDWHPIQGEFSYIVPSVFGIGSGSNATLNRMKWLVKKERMNECCLVVLSFSNHTG